MVRFKIFQIGLSIEYLCFRVVCETLLHHEKMVYQAQQPFVRAFQLIRKIIGGVDYKVSS